MLPLEKTFTDISETILCEESLSGKRWVLREGNMRAASAMAREHQIPELLAGILAARGLAPDEAYNFLNPSLKNSLPDPSHLLDMDIAAERVAAAVIAGEHIAVFGDYDVDGATSTAVLLRYFRALGAHAIPYIPDRLAEGYGPNTPALLGLKAQGISLVITVDCGTLSHAPIEAATNAGLDIIVVDHHQGEARKPNALAIVNPNRLDETSPHRHMAAVGVAFLLCVAINRVLRAGGFFTTRKEPDLKSLLDLVALGTVCDMVPLTGVNRAFVAQGLKVMGTRQNIGIAALLDVARSGTAPNAYTCGFLLGPRVNAGGRVGKSDYGARLLSTEDDMEARALAQELDRYNEERKAIESMMLEEALAQAEEQRECDVMIVHSGHWHPGVIGIIAGRLKERYGKPVAAIAFADGVGKASCRSVTGFDFGASVIAAVAEGVLVGGGGHAMAAGFTVEQAKLEALREFLEARFARVRHVLEFAKLIKVDALLSVSGAHVECSKNLELAGPYGMGNPQAKLVVERAKLVMADIVGENHVKLAFTDAGGLPGRLSGIAFRCADTPLGQALLSSRGKVFSVLGTLKCDSWNGRESACLQVEDAAIV